MLLRDVSFNHSQYQELSGTLKLKPEVQLSYQLIISLLKIFALQYTMFRTSDDDLHISQQIFVMILKKN